MHTEDARVFSLTPDSLPPMIDRPSGIASVPREAGDFQEAPSRDLFLWAVLGFLVILLTCIAVFAGRMYRDGMQTNAQIQSSMTTQSKALASLQSGIMQTSQSAQFARSQSADAVSIAQSAREVGDHVTKRIDTIQYNQRLLVGQMVAMQREIAELRKRLPAATITGTVNAQPKPETSNAIGPMLDQMITEGKDLKRVRRPGASEDSWLVTMSDGKTVDIRPWGSTSDAVFATDTVTGVSYRVDRKTGIAVPSGK